MMIADKKQDRARRVKFEQPLQIRVMAIDGTSQRESRLIDVSDSGAEIELPGHALEISEFFLVLTGFGKPVFRRCKREWVNGERVGVSFNNSNIGFKSLEQVRHELTLVA
jgi:hypothetical protein